MLTRIGSHCSNATEAPELIAIKLENAVAPGEKEPPGSEKRHESKLVLEIPKSGLALGRQRFFCTIIIPPTLSPGLWSSSLASLWRGPCPGVGVSFPKSKSECDAAQLQQIPTALGAESKLFPEHHTAPGMPSPSLSCPSPSLHTSAPGLPAFLLSF